MSECIYVVAYKITVDVSKSCPIRLTTSFHFVLLGSVNEDGVTISTSFAWLCFNVYVGLNQIKSLPLFGVVVPKQQKKKKKKKATSKREFPKP